MEILGCFLLIFLSPGFSSNASLDTSKESISIKADNSKDSTDAGEVVNVSREEYNFNHITAGVWYKNENALPKRLRKRHKSPRPTVLSLAPPDHPTIDKLSDGGSSGGGGGGDRTSELIGETSQDVSSLDDTRSSCRTNESELKDANRGSCTPDRFSNDEPLDVGEL